VTPRAPAIVEKRVPIRPLGRPNEGFCGQDEVHVAALPQPLVFWRAHFLAIIEMRSSSIVALSAQKGVAMPVKKMIATFASVAAAACGLFAFSWVGLALLGF
jgi:hypothetical protein